MSMMKVLISACLLGEPCRYDGKPNCDLSHSSLSGKIDFIPVCPEVLGGLPVPRECAELKSGRVVTQTGRDVSAAFHEGAARAWEAVRDQGCVCAILKARSPSCGHGRIYDGTFTHTVIDGDGVFSALLQENGIKVFSEEEFGKIVTFLEDGCSPIAGRETQPGCFKGETR